MELNIQNLSFTYAKKKAPKKVVFSNLSFTIPSGSFYSIVGPSGCGKTTLLRCLAGLAEYEGTILGDGVSLEALGPEKRQFAYISQEYALYPHMTVFDNLAYPLKSQGVPYDEIFKRVYAVADSLGLRPFLTRKPKQLSGGQCQRVAFGRAMIRFAKVYLLDEPFSNIDEKLSFELKELLRQLHEETGATFVYCTHQLEEAFALSNRILLLSQEGKILQEGTPRELYDHPKNEEVRAFIHASDAAHAAYQEIVKEP